MTHHVDKRAIPPSTNKFARRGRFSGVKAPKLFPICMLLLACMLIGIVLLASTSTCCVDGHRDQAAQAKMHEFAAKLETYRIITGRYPTEGQGLAALVEKPTIEPIPERWKAQFSELPKDPWLNSYIYRLHQGPTPDEDTYELLSPGPDLELNTDDDISNLDE